MFIGHLCLKFHYQNKIYNYFMFLFLLFIIASYAVLINYTIKDDYEITKSKKYIQSLFTGY